MLWWCKCCFMDWKCGVALSPLVHGRKQRKFINCYYVNNWGQNSNIVSFMLLETGAWSMEVLPMQRVYNYITEVKNMPDHKLPKKAWNVGCKVRKTNKIQIISFGRMLDVVKIAQKQKTFWKQCYPSLFTPMQGTNARTNPTTFYYPHEPYLPTRHNTSLNLLTQVRF